MFYSAVLFYLEVNECDMRAIDPVLYKSLNILKPGYADHFNEVIGSSRKS